MRLKTSKAPKSSSWLLLFTMWVSLILKHPQVVFLQNELLENEFEQNWTANGRNIYALMCCEYMFLELAVFWRHDFPIPEVVGKPMAVRVFHFRNVWICFDVACTRRWNSWWNRMIHEAWSHFQGIWYALGIWISPNDWLCRDLEHDVWYIDDLQTFTFCKTTASCCLMSPSFRSPGRALGTSGFIGSVEKLRGHFDDQIWPLLHHIQQRAKVSNASAYELEWNWTGSYNLRIQCFAPQKQRQKSMGSVESIVFILRWQICQTYQLIHLGYRYAANSAVWVPVLSDPAAFLEWLLLHHAVHNFPFVYR